MNASRLEGLRETLAGKQILVTGVTGFVAKVWVAMLLDTVPEIGRIVLLARGKRGRGAAARIQDVVERSPCFRPLRARHGADLGAFLQARVEVVDGDLRHPMLGIAPALLDSLLPRLDAVVHVGGLTDFSPDPRDGIAANIRGARHAADVAARSHGRRLVHISTCFVAGRGSREVGDTLEPGIAPNGTRFDPEGELVAVESLCDAVDARIPDAADARRERIAAGTRRAEALGWPNLYTYTKGLAEHFLARRTDVSVHIVRPAIVECARTFPFEGWNEGINTSGPLVWLIGTMMRRLPLKASHRFDVVPVDSVARGMTLALAESLRSHGAHGVCGIWQLSSSAQNPLTLGRALDLSALGWRRKYGASDTVFERLVLAHLDTITHARAASDDFVLPALRKTTRSLRDALVAFDPDAHLPGALRERFGATLAKKAQRAAKSLGTTSRTLGQVEGMLLAYQPFVWDDDVVFRADTVRDATEWLTDGERATFGWDIDTVDWRHYWLEVQMPGLERWSLPLLRGERVEEDPRVPITPPLRTTEAAPAPRRHWTTSAEAAGDEAE